jgi:serine/threonine-protein kinase RsbW
MSGDARRDPEFAGLLLAAQPDWNPVALVCMIALMKLRLGLSNHGAALDRLREFVTEFSHLYGLPDDERGRVLVIFDELLTNVLTHGYEGAPIDGHVEAALSLDGNRLIIEFIDNGRPFDPLTPPPPDLDLPLAERPIGGIGIAIVRALVDTIGYTREGEHNHLILGRTVSRPSGGAATEGARQS